MVGDGEVVEVRSQLFRVYLGGGSLLAWFA